MNPHRILSQPCNIFIAKTNGIRPRLRAKASASLRGNARAWSAWPLLWMPEAAICWFQLVSVLNCPAPPTK